MKKSEIQIRDPFIVLEDGKYYMFGSTDKDIWEAPGVGFDAYITNDLENFEGPFNVFSNSPEFWGEKNFWAPEVHKYKEKYYMFATFWGNGTRGSQILVADSILGPYKEHSEGIITPKDWLSLDATLYVENGRPYAVFCHEWLQVGDGEMVLVELSQDLKRPVGEATKLFNATEAPWVSMLEDYGRTGYITDGPFLYTTAKGTLLMLWSSYKNGKYALGIARSENGIKGPWLQKPQALFEADGGHGMIFKSYEGKIYLSIHTPNNTPMERPVFIELEEVDDDLKIK